MFMGEAWETIIHVSWMQGLLLEDMLDMGGDALTHIKNW